MLTMIPNVILSVSQLNRQVKSYLENELGIIQVEGEISNLSKPSSGHFYFTLKDSSAQIRCVFFKNRHFGVPVNSLCDGKQIVATGSLSLYEARGDYQLIVQDLSEAGLGALYQRFEALKNKLTAEGLFNPSRKKPLPAMPKAIGIITSPTGAAIRDMLSTLARRFPLAKVYIYPCEVQGASAPSQLIKALIAAHTNPCCEVLILARGGGSIEDLWAFNDEQLARQIAASTIPIVSGVGHETDFTIADFVADYRAETPTAAAAAVTPNSLDLIKLLDNLACRLQTAINRIVQNYQLKLTHLLDKVASPQQAIAAYWQRLDYLERGLQHALSHVLNQKSHRLHLLTLQIQAHNPKALISHNQIRLDQLLLQLTQYMHAKLTRLKYQFNAALATLHAVSPLATLDRGYAIATKNQQVLFHTNQVLPGETINIHLAKGALCCEVQQIMPPVEELEEYHA